MPTERPLVAVRLPPGQALLSAIDAALDGGNAVAPLPVDVPSGEVSRLLRALRPHRLVDESGSTALDGGEAVAEDTAIVVATSGSTGAPRGVELSATALTASARASLRRLGATAADRWLCCLPLHHVAGLQVLVRSRLLGTAPVIHDRFDPCRVAAETDATMVALVPTMLGRLLDGRQALSHLRLVLLGGAAAPDVLLRRAADAGVDVVTTYGMTETSGGCVYDSRPLDGVTVDLTAGDRIRIAGPVLFTRYRGGGGPDPDGLVTQDIGRLVDGRLEVLGRADDVIVTGGENVPAARVAAVLAEHPGVAEAAVTGRPDPEWGERVVAVVVPRGEAAPTLEELRAFVAARAPRSFAPRELVVVTALPRLPSGKVAGRAQLLAVAEEADPT